MLGIINISAGNTVSFTGIIVYILSKKSQLYYKENHRV